MTVHRLLAMSLYSYRQLHYHYSHWCPYYPASPEAYCGEYYRHPHSTAAAAVAAVAGAKWPTCHLIDEMGEVK